MARTLKRDWRENMVRMVCLHKGCPRKVWRPRSTELPAVVKTVQSDCDWHEQPGMKEYPEYYYDAKGRELDWETWKPVQKYK